MLDLWIRFVLCMFWNLLSPINQYTVYLSCIYIWCDSKLRFFKARHTSACEINAHYTQNEKNYSIKHRQYVPCLNKIYSHCIPRMLSFFFLKNKAHHPLYWVNNNVIFLKKKTKLIGNGKRTVFWVLAHQLLQRY